MRNTFRKNTWINVQIGFLFLPTVLGCWYMFVGLSIGGWFSRISNYIEGFKSVQGWTGPPFLRKMSADAHLFDIGYGLQAVASPALN